MSKPGSRAGSPQTTEGMFAWSPVSGSLSPWSLSNQSKPEALPPSPPFSPCSAPPPPTRVLAVAHPVCLAKPVLSGVSHDTQGSRGAYPERIILGTYMCRNEKWV